MTKTATTEWLIKNYHRKFYEKGKTPKEVAEITGIPQRTIYNLLWDVAEKENTDRTIYLYCPHSKHKPRGANKSSAIKENQNLSTDELMLDIEKICSEIFYSVNQVNSLRIGE